MQPTVIRTTMTAGPEEVVVRCSRSMLTAKGQRDAPR